MVFEATQLNKEEMPTSIVVNAADPTLLDITLAGNEVLWTNFQLRLNYTITSNLGLRVDYKVTDWVLNV